MVHWLSVYLLFGNSSQIKYIYHGTDINSVSIFIFKKFEFEMRWVLHRVNKHVYQQSCTDSVLKQVYNSQCFISNINTYIFIDIIIIII